MTNETTTAPEVETIEFDVIVRHRVKITAPANEDRANVLTAALDAFYEAERGTFQGTSQDFPDVAFDVDDNGRTTGDDTMVAIESDSPVGSPGGIGISTGLHGLEETEFPVIDNRDSFETWVWTDPRTHIEITYPMAWAIVRSFAQRAEDFES